MYSNQMRLTGLSGLDTETMVKQLMQAESMKLDKLQKNRQKLSWQQEGYRTTIDALRGFQSTFLDTIKAGSLWSGKTFSGSKTSVKVNGQDSTAVSVASGSVAGDYTLKVYQTAKGEKVESKKEAAGELTLDGDINYEDIAAGDYFNVSLDGGAKKKIEFSQADVDAIADAVANVDTNGFAQDYATNNPTASAAEIEEAVAAEKDRVAADAFAASLNSKLNATFGVDPAIGGSANKAGAEVDPTSGKVVIKVTTGHELAITDVATADAVDGEDTLITKLGIRNGESTDFDMAKSMETVLDADLFDSEGNATFSINGTDFTVNKEQSLSEVFKEINQSGAGVRISFDEGIGTFAIESTETGEMSSVGALTGEFLTDGLGFDKSDTNTVTKGRDAIVEVNGIRTSRSSNSFSFMGLDLTLNPSAQPDPPANAGDPVTPTVINISVSNDAEQPLNAVKKFVEEYNKLIDTLNSQYKTSRPKTVTKDYFEPLTDTEKEGMSDDEVEKWEAKAKTGLNNNDTLMSGLARSMRGLLSQGIEMEDGSTMYLSQIGLTTTNDPQDGGKIMLDEEKFTEAFNADPEAVKNMFAGDGKTGEASRGFAGRLSDLMKSYADPTSMSKGLLVEKAGMAEGSKADQNDMSRQLSADDRKIDDMLSWLADREDYYYSMFAKIESAMMQAQSQQSYLTSMLGGA